MKDPVKDFWDGFAITGIIIGLIVLALVCGAALGKVVEWLFAVAPVWVGVLTIFLGVCTLGGIVYKNTR